MVYSGGSTKRFFFNHFPPQNAIWATMCTVVYIPLPPFRFNHHAILSSRAANNRWWISAFCLSCHIKIGCSYSASPSLFLKHVSLFGGVLINRRFHPLCSITVVLHVSLTTSASPYLPKNLHIEDLLHTVDLHFFRFTPLDHEPN